MIGSEIFSFKKFCCWPNLLCACGFHCWPIVSSMEFARSFCYATLLLDLHHICLCMKPFDMPKKRSRKKRSRRNKREANAKSTAVVPVVTEDYDDEPLELEGNMEYASVWYHINTQTPVLIAHRISVLCITLVNVRYIPAKVDGTIDLSDHEEASAAATAAAAPTTGAGFISTPNAQQDKDCY